jgi:signal transduction histidine kinase
MPGPTWREGLPRLEIVGVDGPPPLLDELLTRPALADIVTSGERMFHLPLQIASATGSVLASAGHPGPVQTLLDSLDARVSVMKHTPQEWDSATAARTATTAAGESLYLVKLAYNQRRIGWVSVGPYVRPEVTLPSPWLLRIAGADGAERVLETWNRVPRASDAWVAEVGNYLATVVELMLFNGHKALVASQMHLASVHESYRELCEKNQRLAEAYDQLKQLDRLKSSFLATISHELRTPLTSIMGYGEMLSEGVAGPLNSDQQEFVATIRTKSEQLLALIVSLLDFSKLEHGKVTLRSDSLRVATVVEEAASMLMASAVKKRVALSTWIRPDLPVVVGDPDLLRQVFVNLVENAVKFTPSGGAVRIEADTPQERSASEQKAAVDATASSAVEIRVTDTGIGIPESEREKIFDAFYQVDQSSTRAFGGTGLGLAIVRRLVLAHHGSIRVQSNHPVGSVFVVNLPAERGHLGEISDTSPPSRDALPPILT